MYGPAPPTTTVGFFRVRPVAMLTGNSLIWPSTVLNRYPLPSPSDPPAPASRRARTWNGLAASTHATTYELPAAVVDAMAGDPTLYTRQDMVEASWGVVEPIQNVWRESPADFPNYAAGTWGPSASDAMLARHGHVWRKP